MATKTALVLLAEGAEEMEAVISIDVLRRGGVSSCLGGGRPYKASAFYNCLELSLILTPAVFCWLVS